MYYENLIHIIMSIAQKPKHVLILGGGNRTCYKRATQI